MFSAVRFITRKKKPTRNRFAPRVVDAPARKTRCMRLWQDKAVEPKEALAINEYSRVLPFSSQLLSEAIEQAMEGVNINQAWLDGERTADEDSHEDPVRRAEAVQNCLEHYRTRLTELKTLETALKHFEENDFINWKPEGATNHGLLNAAIHAYAKHQGLVLSPEVFLFTIMQSVARFILSVDQGRYVPEDRRDVTGHFLKCFEKVSIAELIRALTISLVEKDEMALRLHSILAPVAAYNQHPTPFHVTLLSAFQARYRYRGVGWCCGIRRIEIEGTPAEWREIADAVHSLKAMPELAPLSPWLDAMIATMTRIADYDANDPASRTFMSRLVRHDPGNCSPDLLSGWIVNMFPYYKGELRTNFPVEGGTEEFEHKSLDESLWCKAPVHVSFPELGDEFDIELVAGVGVEEGKRDDLNLVRPVLVHGIWAEDVVKLVSSYLEA